MKNAATARSNAKGEGVEKPIVNKRYIKVPDGPGLGFTPNEEAIKKQLREPGFFEPMPQ